MATSRQGGSVQSRINMVLFGTHGAGKSRYSLNSMYLKREDGKPFRVVYIDNENGSIDDYIDDLIADGIDVRNLLIFYTTSLVETKELIKTATKREAFKDDDGNVYLDADGEPFVADMIIVDGTTVLHKSAIQARREFSKKRAGVRADKQEKSQSGLTAAERFVMVDGADIELKDYSAINYEGQALVLDLTASGLHYIVTAREKEKIDKQVIKVNGVDKEVAINTGIFEPEGFKELGYNAKTIARLYRDENDPTVKMWVEKDRTGTYEKHVPIEDPTILDYQKMIDKNKGRVAFAPINSMNEDIKREMEKVEREVLGTTIAEAEGKVPTVDEALEEKNTVVADNLDALKAEYKSLCDTLTTMEKQRLKELLGEKGLVVNPKGADAAEMKIRLELVKSIKSA